VGPHVVGGDTLNQFPLGLRVWNRLGLAEKVSARPKRGQRFEFVCCYVLIEPQFGSASCAIDHHQPGPMGPLPRKYVTDGVRGTGRFVVDPENA
jgi:hypothetical protein